MLSLVWSAWIFLELRKSSAWVHTVPLRSATSAPAPTVALGALPSTASPPPAPGPAPGPAASAETTTGIPFLKAQLAAAKAAYLGASSMLANPFTTQAPDAGSGAPEAGGPSVEWLYDPLWSGVAENPLQQRSRFVLLRNAVVTGMPGTGNAQVFLPDDVSETTVSALQQLPPFKVHPRNPPEQKVTFSRARGKGARPTRSIEGPVLLLPPHTPDNLFHLHNDLVMKVAWLLRTNSLAPAETTLLLFQSGVAERAHLFHLLERILKQAIRPRSNAASEPGGLSVRCLIPRAQLM